MQLVDRIQQDLTAAMKARDAERTGTLRMVVAAFKNARVAAGHSGEVSDEEALELLSREAKKRAEAATAYTQAGRGELADKERREEAIIRAYLPEQMAAAEIEAIVDAAVVQTAASGPGDLGKVMAVVMPQVKGKADGKLVNKIVRDRLEDPAGR